MSRVEESGGNARDCNHLKAQTASRLAPLVGLNGNAVPAAGQRHYEYRYRQKQREKIPTKIVGRLQQQLAKNKCVYATDAAKSARKLSIPVGAAGRKRTKLLNARRLQHLQISYGDSAAFIHIRYGHVWPSHKSGTEMCRPHINLVGDSSLSYKSRMYEICHPHTIQVRRSVALTQTSYGDCVVFIQVWPPRCFRL